MREDGRADTTQLIAGFRNFAKVSNKAFESKVKLISFRDRRRGRKVEFSIEKSNSALSSSEITVTST